MKTHSAFLIAALPLLCGELLGATGLGGGAADGKLLTEQHCYLLQFKGKREKNVEALAAFGADTFILDPYAESSGEESGRYTSDELNRIRAGATTSRPRVLLAYLSIGEAEDYRPYWNPDWVQKHEVMASAPGWLVRENPDWPGNYVVKYWKPEWQAIIFGNATAPLDKLMAQGFDGVYLDIIDGFETFENGVENAANPETGRTYRQDMIEFVKAIAAYARATKPGFLIVPQNGAELLADAAYRQVISGIGQEDLYTDGKKDQPAEETARLTALLKLLSAEGKAVLVTDYSRNRKKRGEVFAKAAADGFSIYSAPRALNKLGSAP